MHDVSGVTGAAPVWLEIMEQLHAAEPAASGPPEAPAGVEQRPIGFEPALEPPSTEWFLSGTEVRVVSVNPPERWSPRITWPPNGLVIALDPNMPHGRQAVLLQSRAYWFQLDGRTLAPADRPVKWIPIPGSQHLQLIGPEGGVFDTVAFTVRRPFLARSKLIR